MIATGWFAVVAAEAGEKDLAMRFEAIVASLAPK